jgi:4-amino-4-deoxy-L-arabinose transferase-like glycosyltransferase
MKAVFLCDYTRRRRGVIFCLLGILALLLRLSPLLRSGSSWAMANVDSPRYVELAKGLRSGCGFARLVDGHCGGLEVLRTPGYPLFLAVTPSLRAVVAVQAIIGAALCVLVGSFVTLYWGACAGAVAELLLALDVPTIVQGSRIMSDVLFQALLAAAVIVQLWVIARGRYDGRSVVGGLGAALLLAAALLVRPVGILLPLIAPVPFLFLPPRVSWRRAIALCVAAFALPAVVMGGWMARNAMRTGTWTLSTVAAINLYYFDAGGVVRYRSGQSLQAVMDGLARELGLPNARDYSDTPAALEPQMVSHGLRILLHDPVATFIVTARTLAWLALVPDRGSLNELLGTDAGATSYLAATTQLHERIRRLWRSPLLTALVTIQFVLIVVTWIGVGRALADLRIKPAREAALILIPFSVALAMMILAAGAEAYPRYRMPAAPFLAMLAGIGWSRGRLSDFARLR